MNLRRCVFAVVPIKDPAFGKTRLAPILDARQRRELCVFLAQRALEVCSNAFGSERTIVVTSAPDVARLAAEAGVRLVCEDAGADDLNAAISLGAAHARLDGAEALLVVPADLALVTVAELRDAADAIPAAPGCLIVPDRHCRGTNVLGLAPVREDLFAFGDQSVD